MHGLHCCASARCAAVRWRSGASCAASRYVTAARIRCRNSSISPAAAPTQNTEVLQPADHLPTKAAVSRLTCASRAAASAPPAATCPRGEQVIDPAGPWLPPGVIDDQVHFRERGLTHKADTSPESRTCAAEPPVVNSTCYMSASDDHPEASARSIPRPRAGREGVHGRIQRQHAVQTGSLTGKKITRNRTLWRLPAQPASGAYPAQPPCP